MSAKPRLSATTGTIASFARPVTARSRCAGVRDHASPASPAAGRERPLEVRAVMRCRIGTRRPPRRSAGHSARDASRRWVVLGDRCGRGLPVVDCPRHRGRDPPTGYRAGAGRARALVSMAPWLLRVGVAGLVVGGFAWSSDSRCRCFVLRHPTHGLQCRSGATEDRRSVAEPSPRVSGLLRVETGLRNSR